MFGRSVMLSLVRPYFEFNPLAVAHGGGHCMVYKQLPIHTNPPQSTVLDTDSVLGLAANL